MPFFNPNDSTEILYGSSGDVRNEINGFMPATTAGHYADENELSGSLIVTSLRKATRLINAYLAPVYADQIPFTVLANVPKELDEIASDISTFYTLRSLSAKVGPLANEKKAEYYDAYLAEKTGILTLLRDRKLQLPELFNLFQDEVKTVRAAGIAPIFDLDDEINYEVDPNLLDDIQKERGQ